MRTNLPAIIIGIVIPIVASTLALLEVNTFLRAVFAVPFVLISPGFAATYALYPGRLLSTTARIALTLGFSLVLIASSAIALTFTVGLTRPVWIGVLGVVSIGATVFALVQHTGSRVREVRMPFAPRQIMLLGLALIIAMSAFAYAQEQARIEPQPPFTQLWILPPADDAPSAFRIGARSFEGVPMEFTVSIASGDQILRDDTFTLADGETWQLQLPSPQRGRQIVVKLYRSDDPSTVYRQVTAPDPAQ